METTTSHGFAVRDGCAGQHASVPVSVAVGHKSTLVTAGLVATLARTPGCDIRSSPVSPYRCSSECPHTAELIFGDSPLLEHLRRQSMVSPANCPLSKAKFVWLTAGDESAADAAKAAGEIDEHLPIECPEDELFGVVRRLLDFAPSSVHPACPTKNSLRTKVSGGLAPGALRRVREYIDQHLTDNLQTDVLARIAALSPGHFNRAFKQSTGLSPHRYVLRKRVAIATDLLRQTGRALADIALEVGFAHQSHFTRTYGAITGETPSACRRRYR